MQHFTPTCHDAVRFVCPFSLRVRWSPLDEWQCSVWETVEGISELQNADATRFPRCVLLLFAIHELTTFPCCPPPPSPAPSCATHSYRTCLQSCCQGCSQVQSSHQTNWVHGIEKVRKSRLSAKQTPQSWTPGAGWIHTANLSLGVEGCSSTLGFVNYTLSGPQVSKMGLLLFALLFISFKTIWKWGKKNCHRNRMVLRDPVLWQ